MLIQSRRLVYDSHRRASLSSIQSSTLVRQNTGDSSDLDNASDHTRKSYITAYPDDGNAGSGNESGGDSSGNESFFTVRTAETKEHGMLGRVAGDSDNESDTSGGLLFGDW